MIQFICSFTGEEGSLLFFKNPQYPNEIDGSWLSGSEVISVSEGSHIKIIVMDASNFWIYVPGILYWTFFNGPGTVVIETHSAEMTEWTEWGGRYLYTWMETRPVNG